MSSKSFKKTYWNSLFEERRNLNEKPIESSRITREIENVTNIIHDLTSLIVQYSRSVSNPTMSMLEKRYFVRDIEELSHAFYLAQNDILCPHAVKYHVELQQRFDCAKTDKEKEEVSHELHQLHGLTRSLGSTRSRRPERHLFQDTEFEDIDIRQYDQARLNYYLEKGAKTQYRDMIVIKKERREQMKIYIAENLKRFEMKEVINATKLPSDISSLIVRYNFEDMDDHELDEQAAEEEFGNWVVHSLDSLSTHSKHHDRPIIPLNDVSFIPSFIVISDNLAKRIHEADDRWREGMRQHWIGFHKQINAFTDIFPNFKDLLITQTLGFETKQCLRTRDNWLQWKYAEYFPKKSNKS